MSSWKRPRILMELGVRGRPLLPHTSWGRAEAKKVKAPSWASLSGLMTAHCSSVHFRQLTAPPTHTPYGKHRDIRGSETNDEQFVHVYKHSF